MSLLFDNSYVVLSNGEKIHRRTQEVSNRVLCPTCKGEDKQEVPISETYPGRETVYEYQTCSTCGGDKVMNEIEVVHYFSGKTKRLERLG